MPCPTRGRDALLARNIQLLRWFNFCTDFRLLAPVAILYYADVAGSYALGASVFSIVMLTAAAFDVPTGLYSDALGRKGSMVIGAGLAVAYATCYAVGSSYWVLVLGAICEGGSRAFYSGNNRAFVYELLAREGREGEYHRYAGRLSAMFQVALGSSALLGGVLGSFSFALIAWLSVLPQIGCLLIAARLDDVRGTSGARNAGGQLRAALGAFRRNGRIRLLTASHALGCAVGETAYEFQAAFFATVWPVWAIGAAKTLSGVLAAASYQVAGPVIDRVGHVAALLTNGVYAWVAQLVALLAPGPLSPILMTSTSVLHGAGSTAEDALRQAEFSPEQRATMASLNSFAASLLFAIVAFLVGLAADTIGPREALLWLQIPAALVLLLHLRFARIVRAGSIARR